MKTLIALVVAAAATAIALPVAASTSSPASTAATPAPADFSHPRQNPYFPLRPGTTTILRGTDDGTRLRERVHVTGRTKMIQGVRTRVVTDVVRRTNGVLAEATSDWYAADSSGNVWYFGEATATYDEHGHLESREGSWRAGLHGAVPGMIMPAHPHAGQAFRQEFHRGHAEDQAWIVGRSGSTKTPLRRFHQIGRASCRERV